MPLKRRILCIFWTIHLALCVLWVLPDRLSAPRSRAWRFVVPYGLYTGADNKYAFFAPTVPSARRVRVRVLCGAEWIPFETTFGNFPCAKVALVEVDYYGIPTISDYRRGERPDWNLLHVLAFMTKEELKSAEESRQ